VILAVWRSAYELPGHSAAARTADLPAGLSGRRAAGQMPGELSAAEQTAWRFARQRTADRRVEQPVCDQAWTASGTPGVADMRS
jgi:hypothetical protein